MGRAVGWAAVALLWVASWGWAQPVPPARTPPAAAPPPAAVGDVEAPRDEIPPEEQPPRNLGELLIKGGWVMIPLAFCALVWLTVTLERVISLLIESRRLTHPALVPAVRSMAEQGQFRRDTVQARCAELGSTAAAVFAVGARHIGQHITVIEKAVNDEGTHHVERIRRFLRVLMITASIAPLLGLLGTVVGMIDAFRRVAEMQGLGMASKLATGIYQALVTTAAGLVIAVLALFCYYVLRSWADALARRLSGEVDEFLDIAAGGSDPQTAVRSVPDSDAAAAGVQVAADAPPA
jgi:biopolymer transport protein ExbB